MKAMQKLPGGLGSVSGFASVLGSWQVCHNLCLALIAALSVVGITLTGMPFLFLSEIAVYVWSIAVVLLGITVYLYFSKKCISRGLIVLNTGLIIAGIPFFTTISVLYWSLGGAIALSGIVLLVRDRRNRRCHNG